MTQVEEIYWLRLGPRMVSSLQISTSLFSSQIHKPFKDMDCNGHEGEDRAAAEEMFVSFLQTSTLGPISELTPCVSFGFGFWIEVWWL